MKRIRRLIVSLDGTWNTRDGSTNVLYSHCLALQCHEKEFEQQDQAGAVERVQVTQEPYYQEGVGTGPLDRLTGGGFGFGLEQHVRKAYDWLVQKFQDGDGKDQPPDEIYIFGFSRGAYTARSLVGLIGTCGLLRRGAPLTVNQLWANYAILGREREERDGGLAGWIFGAPSPEFRRITDLVLDPWHINLTKLVVGDEIRGLRQGVKLRRGEELLVKWSRRVKITYLGVYDTVGAMGWDALAIPGLRSKLAVQHNMRPTSIIQKCRHALAIDEHRSSFAHTPFVAYIGEKSAEEMQRLAGSCGKQTHYGHEQPDTNRRQEVECSWTDRIEQRWFVGAHSNIGGGYGSNRLAQRPLEWIMEGASQAGLLCEKLPPLSRVSCLDVQPRDSYAEFAAPLWSMVFRAKRYYRRMNPDPEFRAQREAAKSDHLRPGFALAHINENVDETVVDYWRPGDAVPPNLIDYARRHQNDPILGPKLRPLASKRVKHTWLGDGFWPHLAIVLWATAAAAGFAFTDKLFCLSTLSTPSAWVLCLIAAVFPLVDFLESRCNHLIAEKGNTSLRQAFLDSVYWTRALGVVLAAVGLAGGVLYISEAGWNELRFAGALSQSGRFALLGTLVAACAAIAVFALYLWNGSRRVLDLLGIISGVVIVPALAALLAIAANVVGHVVSAALGLTRGSEPVPVLTPEIRTGGLLLLLQALLVYLARTFTWVDEPMRKANLGSIWLLQKERTPSGVANRLSRWCKMLGEHHGINKSTGAMRRIVEQALWRDALGLIPIYTLVLLFGLWFGTTQLGWQNWWPPLAYLWWVLPLAIALADYMENVSHFRYLSLLASRQSSADRQAEPNWLVTHSTFVVSMAKLLAFIICFVAIVWIAVPQASIKILKSPQLYGWRGLIALLVTTSVFVGIAALFIWGRIYRLLQWMQNREDRPESGGNTSADGPAAPPSLAAPRPRPEALCPMKTQAKSEREGI